MTDRAVSTVVDASLFLLLVGVAVLTLVGAPTPTEDPAAGRDHEVVTVLGSSTAQVNVPRDASADDARSAHGTRAGLLAAATIGDASVDGVGIAPEDGFRAAVANATRPTLAGEGWRAQVVAVWRPYPGAHVEGELRVGHAPPPRSDVHAATATVGSDLPSAREDARVAARDGGYDAVADAIASAVVDGLFPPIETRAALADPAARNWSLARYRAAGRAYGIEVGESAASGRIGEANRKLRDAMSERIATDLRPEFDSPTAAAEAVDVGTVRITVRTWST